MNNIGFSLIEKDLDLNNDFVLLLNNDCLIFEDALEKLLAAINISKSISAAGGKLFTKTEIFSMVELELQEKSSLCSS